MMPAEIHPSPSAGDGRLEPRRTTYKRGDRVIELRKCAQCGFINRDGIETIGDSQDSPGIQQTSSQQTSKYVQNAAPNGSFESWPYGGYFQLSLSGTLQYFADLWWVNGFTSAAVTFIEKSRDCVDGNFSMHWAVKANPGSFSSFSIHSDTINLPSNFIGVPLLFDCWIKTTQNFGGFNYLTASYDSSTINTANPTADGAWHYVVSQPFTVTGKTINFFYGPATATILVGDTYIDKIRLYRYSQQTINDQTITAGCRLCGSLNSIGVNRNWRDYGTGIDLSNK